MRDSCREVAAKDHVTFACIGFGIARRICTPGSNQKVVEPVPVHVTCSAHCMATVVACFRAKDGYTGRP